jgi:hypothetical protein
VCMSSGRVFGCVLLFGTEFVVLRVPKRGCTAKRVYGVLSDISCVACVQWRLLLWSAEAVQAVLQAVVASPTESCQRVFFWLSCPHLFPTQPLQ